MEKLRIFFRINLAIALMLAFLGGFFPVNFGNNFFDTALAKTKKKTIKKISKKSKENKSKLDLLPVFPEKIVGDSQCVEKTDKALGVLLEKSKSDFEKVAASIGTIECAEKNSGVFVFENPVRFRVGWATSQSDKFWYASVLVHESCHVEQYRNYISLHPDKSVPSEIFSGADAESECLLVQYNCLSRLDAGQSLLDYTKKIAQTSYWDVSVEKRWW
jgi:hypothetical protein